MKHVIVTGVSTGIGYAAVGALLERGFSVFGSLRSDREAARLSAEMGRRFRPLVFDVRDGKGVEAAVAQVRTHLGGHNLTALVNNAGISCVGPLQHVPLEQVREQLEVNVLGLLRVTQAFLPLLGARAGAPQPRGRVVNLSSVSGRIAYPFMGPYAASKHAVEALSDSLRRELLLYGIEVVLIEPGNTRTPILDKATRQVEAYMQTEYATVLRRLHETELGGRLLAAMPVQRVTRAILKAVEHPRPRTRYPVPANWLTGWVLPLLLPARLLDRIVARLLGVPRAGGL